MGYIDKEKQREYQRRWYKKNKDYVVNKQRERRGEQRKIIRDAKSVPCSDCGREYPYYVMDFDHREDKLANISQMPVKYNSFEILDAELAKCDVVCSNCHRIRSYERGYNNGCVVL